MQEETKVHNVYMTMTKSMLHKTTVVWLGWMIGTPACANDNTLMRSRVGNHAIVMDKGGVEGHTINVESDGGELDTQGEVMPLAVTHLGEGQGDEV